MNGFLNIYIAIGLIIAICSLPMIIKHEYTIEDIAKDGIWFFVSLSIMYIAFMSLLWIFVGIKMFFEITNELSKEWAKKKLEKE